MPSYSSQESTIVIHPDPEPTRTCIRYYKDLLETMEYFRKKEY